MAIFEKGSLELFIKILINHKTHSWNVGLHITEHQNKKKKKVSHEISLLLGGFPKPAGVLICMTVHSIRDSEN